MAGRFKLTRQVWDDGPENGAKRIAQIAEEVGVAGWEWGEYFVEHNPHWLIAQL